MDIPMNLAVEYAKQSIADVINRCFQELNIPPFAMESIIKDFHQEISALAARALNEANAAYQEAQQKEAEATTETEIKEAE